MNSKEKQIEEMAEVVDKEMKQGFQRLMEETRKYVKENHNYSSKNDYDKAHEKTIAEIIAEALYNAGYTQPIKDDDIVLTKEEYERLQIKLKSLQDTDFFKEAYISQLKEELKQANKETAREILEALKERLSEVHIFGSEARIIDEFAKEHGVEVE